MVTPVPQITVPPVAVITIAVVTIAVVTIAVAAIGPGSGYRGNACVARVRRAATRPVG
jgi:hypothetical protein